MDRGRASRASLESWMDFKHLRPVRREKKKPQVSLQPPPGWPPGFPCQGTGWTTFQAQGSPLFQELNQSRLPGTPPFLGPSPTSTTGGWETAASSESPSLLRVTSPVPGETATRLTPPLQRRAGNSDARGVESYKSAEPRGYKRRKAKGIPRLGKDCPLCTGCR